MDERRIDGHHRLLLVGLALLFAPFLIDPILVATVLACAAVLWRLAHIGPDALSLVPFEGVIPAHRALQIAAGMMALSALTDALVAVDFVRTGGIHAASLIGAAHALALLGLGAAAVVAGRRVRVEEAPVPAPPGADPRDEDVLARIEGLLRDHALYRDPDLTLERLARKAGLPARRISMAVNRLTGRNISQFINERRVAEACRLLATTQDSVTEVMFAAGFLTKSNFNREFRRVTGMSPTAWRAGQAQAPAGLGKDRR